MVMRAPKTLAEARDIFKKWGLEFRQHGTGYYCVRRPDPRDRDDPEGEDSAFHSLDFADAMEAALQMTRNHLERQKGRHR